MTNRSGCTGHRSSSPGSSRPRRAALRSLAAMSRSTTGFSPSGLLTAGPSRTELLCSRAPIMRRACVSSSGSPMAPWQDDAPSWRDDEFWLDVDDEDLLDEWLDDLSVPSDETGMV